MSPSSNSWLNYDDQKLKLRFQSAQASRRGTDLHDLAHEAIRLGVKLAKSNQALSTYVNDAISYKMFCEQLLYFSENCFGSADTISFRRNKLRIHDLKTGIIAAKEKQLEVYAALFCLEYSISPYDIDTELRIYQRDEIRVYEAIPESIDTIMETIVRHDARLREIRNDDNL